MSRSRGFFMRRALAVVAAFTMASACAAATAQLQDYSDQIQEPVAHRVYQRDANGRSDVPITFRESLKDAKAFDVSISGPSGPVVGSRYEDGRIFGVPTGGPYYLTLDVRPKAGHQGIARNVGPFFVGDLWVLSGQSNMEGVGNLIDAAPPNDKVMLLGMDGHWARAEEPLHWLVDSPDPVHSGNPKDRAERSKQQHKHRNKGAGLGLPFATAMVEATGVPVGLIATAHGGTSMEQWDPAKKDEGGNSLYGSMMKQFQLAGGKVKGVLWYQGESDAMGNDAWPKYSRVFSEFIASVRSDFGQPELPFYFVQIGRFVLPDSPHPKGWNSVQDAQRRLAERIANTAVISVIDLELDDLIHVGTQGMKRAGRRLALIAQRELFGQVGATTPTLDRVSKGPGHTLIVKFKGVNMTPPHPGPAITSFTNLSPLPSHLGVRAMAANAPQGNVMMPAYAMPPAPSQSAAASASVGLTPDRHIAGFSIRKEDGTKIPLIYEACVGQARDTVVLKLVGDPPPKSALWYGYGLSPYCNLVDGMDMAVPVFGPIALDAIVAVEPAAAAAPARAKASAKEDRPVKALIITGDNIGAHKWKETTPALEELLEKGGKIEVDVTRTPSKDLTDENLARYDVFVLNYRDTAEGPPESRWSDANKEAFLKAVRGGKGLVGYHFASAAFVKPNWEEFEKAVAGGWRAQGFHGPAHSYLVKKTDVKHPLSEGLPHQFQHEVDELYQNSMMVPGSVVLATAFSDPKRPKGTGKDEPLVWVNHYGKGRVVENVMGHDVKAMGDPHYREWMRNCVLWAGGGLSD